MEREKIVCLKDHLKIGDYSGPKIGDFFLLQESANDFICNSCGPVFAQGCIFLLSLLKRQGGIIYALIGSLISFSWTRHWEVYGHMSCIFSLCPTFDRQAKLLAGQDWQMVKSGLAASSDVLDSIHLANSPTSHSNRVFSFLKIYHKDISFLIKLS